jgi:hypothetical protein
MCGTLDNIQAVHQAIIPCLGRPGNDEGHSVDQERRIHDVRKDGHSKLKKCEGRMLHDKLCNIPIDLRHAVLGLS